MDLQSFCVQNRGKVQSFPFLRSAVQSTEKMRKSFEFGVPVNGPIMEENCIKNVPNISCNAHFNFQDMTKSQDCHSKKSCFDHLNKFSQFTFSRVVGGFVGSKSQGGSASREPHQVWDVILRQLVNTTYQATMNNNAQQYFSIGEAVSQSIFGQFNDRENSTLDFTSFIFARPCDFFASKKPSGSMPYSYDSHCQDRGGDTAANEQVKFSTVPCDSQSHNVNMEKNEVMEKPDVQQSTCKQSYADVAKAFAATRPDFMFKSERCRSMPVTSLPHNRFSRKGNERGNNKTGTLNGNCYTQPSYNNSSQNRYPKKSTTVHDKCEEHTPSKFARDKFSRERHFRTENSGTSKLRIKETNSTQSVIPTKDPKGQEEKRKFNKFKNPNMREKERKKIDFQVHEDVVYACSLPEEVCQNWRCDHNRMPNIHRGRAEFNNQRRDFRTKNSKSQSRLHSPPPRTLTPDCVNVNKPEDHHPKNQRREFRTKNYKSQSRLHSPPPRTLIPGCVNVNKPEDHHPKKEIQDISEVRKEPEEILCKNEESVICSSLNLPRSGDDNCESSFSSSPTSNSVVLSQRLRVASECSVDSEDSVVFERDDNDLDETESDPGLDSDSGSDNSSECESEEEDCDEVDFCYIIPSENININITGSTYADAFSSVPERLKDINAKWRKENAALPKVGKVPKKVHFPCAEKLVKVHQMIYWPFAYREARRGPWEEIGRDRCRFQLRIDRAEQELSHVLDSGHRRRIWEERMCDVGNT